MNKKTTNNSNTLPKFNST